MSTLHEMAEAFEQARTAPDVTDRAAAPWAERCISCQDDHDKREARRHG